MARQCAPSSERTRCSRNSACSPLRARCRHGLRRAERIPGSDVEIRHRHLDIVVLKHVGEGELGLGQRDLPADTHPRATPERGVGVVTPRGVAGPPFRSELGWRRPDAAVAVMGIRRQDQQLARFEVSPGDGHPAAWLSGDAPRCRSQPEGFPNDSLGDRQKLIELTTLALRAGDGTATGVRRRYRTARLGVLSVPAGGPQHTNNRPVSRTDDEVPSSQDSGCRGSGLTPPAWPPSPVGNWADGRAPATRIDLVTSRLTANRTIWAATLRDRVRQ